MDSACCILHYRESCGREAGLDWIQPHWFSIDPSRGEVWSAERDGDCMPDVEVLGSASSIRLMRDGILAPR